MTSIPMTGADGPKSSEQVSSLIKRLSTAMTRLAKMLPAALDGVNNAHRRVLDDFRATRFRIVDVMVPEFRS